MSINIGNKYLPYCEFKCLKNIDKFDVHSISENSLIGYILEVDLKHPDELYYLYNDYPLPSEKHAISYDALSNYCKKIADQYGIKVRDVKKLVPTFQLYSSLGMKLIKIHKILNFKQSDWLKKYIHFNNEKRTNAANSLEKEFFKRMINSVHGKTMENL